MRDHEPILLEEFNGLWQRGTRDSVPMDHFSDCSNIQYIQSGFKTRDGADTAFPYQNVVRIFNFNQPNAHTLLILDSNGNFFHTGSPTPFSPILTIAAATDFNCLIYNGRAYITPMKNAIGLQNDFIYVYKGDGTPARRAGGMAPTTAPAAANSATVGNVEAGFHNFAVVFETDTGFLTALSPAVSLNATGGFKVDLSSIPVSLEGSVVARRIVATKAIDPTLFTGSTTDYQFFFVTGGRIADNVTTTLTVNFFDVELLADASHLIDNFANIPAGANIGVYHNRMVVAGSYTDISLAHISAPGEPEAINQVSGLVIAPLDGDALTNCAELRDVLYLFKQVRTIAVVDNGGDPSSWPVVIIDHGIGASVHGIATILSSGGINVDYLMIVDYSGILLFNGTYTRPELTWKIKDYWFSLDRLSFDHMQIVNDSLGQVLYISLTNRQMLIGDYSNGLDHMKIRWAKWIFDFQATTIALFGINTLTIGSNQSF